MKLRPVAAALAIAAAGVSAPALAQVTHLGTLGAGNTSFSASFARIFGWGSPLGAFTDYYTFNLATPAAAAGGAAVGFNFGSLNLTLNSVRLTGGSLSSAMVDSSPGSFNFAGLGAGSYQLAVNGRLRDNGWGGYAQYNGTIHAVASPAPEPAAIAMMMAGLGVLGFMARRRRQG